MTFDFSAIHLWKKILLNVFLDKGLLISKKALLLQTQKVRQS